MDIKKFQTVILDWYRKNRRDLPWRRTQDPYKILVSEIMLQQTQVTRVIPKYEEFLRSFPTLESLAKAPDKKLMAVWSGLGYWRRAKYLKETARLLVKRVRAADLRRRVGPRHVTRGGVKRDEKPQLERFFTREPRELEKLPGIGPYTARALACFAFGSKEAFLDTNIRRVYLHFFFPSTLRQPADRSGQVPQRISDKEILPIAQKAIDKLPKSTSAREWHYALFDYGAIVLKDKSVNKRSRHYHKQSKFEGSFRSFRTKAVRFILANPQNKVSRRALHAFLQKELKNSVYTPEEILASILKDNLIKKSKTHYSL